MVGYIPGNSELNPMAVRLDRDTRELWIDHVGAPADPRHRPAWTWMLPIPATPEYAARLLDRLRGDAATVIASSTVDDSGRIRFVGSDGWAAYGRIHAATAQEGPAAMDDVLTPARALHMIERDDDNDLQERLWRLNEMTLLDVTQPDPARYAHHQRVKQARWAAAEEQLKVMLEQHRDTRTVTVTPLTTEQLATHRDELDRHVAGLQRDIAAAAETAISTYLRARDIGLDQPSATSEFQARDARETRRRLAAELPAITAADIVAAPEHRRTMTAHVAARQRAVRQLEHAREHVSQDAVSMVIEGIDQHGLSEVHARRDVENDVLVASSTAVEIANDDLATELDQAHGLTIDLDSTIPDHPKLIEEYRDLLRNDLADARGHLYVLMGEAVRHYQAHEPASGEATSDELKRTLAQEATAEFETSEYVPSSRSEHGFWLPGRAPRITDDQILAAGADLQEPLAALAGDQRQLIGYDRLRPDVGLAAIQQYENDTSYAQGRVLTDRQKSTHLGDAVHKVKMNVESRGSRVEIDKHLHGLLGHDGYPAPEPTHGQLDPWHEYDLTPQQRAAYRADHATEPAKITELVEPQRYPQQHRDAYIKGAQDPEWAELNWDNNIAPALDARAEFIDEYADPEATAREALEEQREEQRQRREIAQVDAEETRLIETYGDPRQGPKGPRSTATKIADRVRHATDRIVHLRSAEEQAQADRAREDHYLSLDQIQHGEHGIERAD